MPAKPRYMQTTPVQKSVALDASTLSYLDQIAPDNISEALRYCVQFAMQHPDALFRATVQHTAAQCRKHQQRYPGNAEPLPIQTATTWTPAPAQATEPIQPAPVIINGVTQGTEEEYLLYGDDDDDTPAQVATQRVEPLEPIVIRSQPLSAAALAAVAAIALTDDEIKALDPARGGQRPFIG